MCTHKLNIVLMAGFTTKSDVAGRDWHVVTYLGFGSPCGQSGKKSGAHLSRISDRCWPEGHCDLIIEAAIGGEPVSAEWRESSCVLATSDRGKT